MSSIRALLVLLPLLLFAPAWARCPNPTHTPQRLEQAEVERVVAQASDVARQLNQPATIAVVDRVGNVLAVYVQAGAASSVRIGSGGQATGGLEGLQVPATLAAISKAVTGAYLSSSGQAFSTRTASFIVQDHFPPFIQNVPAGPLFGVQFSQLPCGDLVRSGDAMGGGPRRSPLGLSADPGGFPLYKQGVVVGGIGVIAGSNPTYTLDTYPFDTDADNEEIIAHSAAAGFAAPDCIRGERITAGGVSLRYSDADARLRASSAILPTGGAYVAVAGYIDVTAPRAGQMFGTPASGVAPERVNLRGEAFALVNPDGSNRFPPVASAELSADDVRTLLDEGLDVGRAARSQIRQPLGAAAQVTVTVVGLDGRILGMARLPDAPMFGTDVSLQKARTAALFSRVDASSRLSAALGATGYQRYINGDSRAAAAFFSRPSIFTDGLAFTARAIGNIARPHFPDGIESRPRGPLSTTKPGWSPFNPGISLDLVIGGLAGSLAPGAPATGSCTAASIGIDNGIQIFPGGVPVYRNGRLVGAVGVSGDGVDQDDMVAFLAISRAGRLRGNGLGHAPASIRADRLGLRYVQCPQSPFNDSDLQNVCASEDLPTSGPDMVQQVAEPSKVTSSRGRERPERRR